MENIGHRTCQQRSGVVPSGTDVAHDTHLTDPAKLSALKNFLNAPLQTDSNQSSLYALRAILRVLKNSELDFSREFDRPNEITVQIDHHYLTITESFIHGRWRIVFQYEGGERLIWDNYAFHALATELSQYIANHAENQFSNAAPIRLLSLDEAKTAYKKLQENMAGWNTCPVPQTAEEIANNVDQTDWRRPQRTMQQRWNLRLANTDFLFENSFPLIGAENVVYEVNGMPVGMLVMRRYDDANEIELLVTHLGSEGVGGSLIEHAINRFIELGHPGKVCLAPLSEESENAFATMGFVGDDENMELDPEAHPNIWSKDGDKRWRLKKHEKKQYLCTFS